MENVDAVWDSSELDEHEDYPRVHLFWPIDSSGSRYETYRKRSFETTIRTRG